MKILFLQKRILFPPDTGWRIRTLNVVRHLARWHDITYLCNVLPTDEDSALAAMRDLGVTLETVPWRERRRGSVGFYGELLRNLASRHPYTVWKDYDPRLRARAAALLGGGGFDLLVCDFIQMALNALGLDAPASLLFQHNVEAEIFARHARGGGSWLRRRYMGLQWHKMRRFEAEAGARFDGAVAVSERDGEVFEREYGWPLVRVIDTAVDLERFSPAGTPADTERVVFVGSLDWLPNQDGMRHFVERIWPAIRRARPQATFQIVGRNPGAGMLRLAQVDGVEVAGSVPDVRPYYAGASVVVIPLLVGGGTRLKAYEAMAMGKAVVSTSLGIEGLPVEPGVHYALADDPAAFAAEVVRLLEDRNAAALLGAQARSLVAERFSAETVARQFEAICREVVEALRPEPAQAGSS